MGRMLRQVPNPTHEWKGLEAGGLNRRYLLRIGDCSWMNVPHAHTYGPPGYPRVLAEQCLIRGVALRFENYVVLRLDEPPSRERLAGFGLESTPDAIIVQMGVLYAARELLALPDWLLAPLRTWVNWRLGHAGGYVHRFAVRPALRHWGRPFLPSARESDLRTSMRGLLMLVRETFPSVPLLMLSPHPLIVEGWADRGLLDEACEMMFAAARDVDVPVLDYRPVVRQAIDAGITGVHGVNGYDLRESGHALVAAELMKWLPPLWLEQGRALPPS